MRLTLLGTGSPLPSLRRASTGHLVEVGGSRIVIDLGPGACRRLLETGCGPAEVTDIFISHLHFDHVGDLPTLLFYCWDRNGGIGALPRITGPRGTAEMVEGLFGEGGAFHRDLRARTLHPRSLEIYRDRGGELPRPLPQFAVTEVDEGGWMEGEGWRIGRFPVHHHQPYLESVGYRIESSLGVFAYTSDVEVTADPAYSASLAELAADADVLVHYFNSFDFDADHGGPSKQALVADLATRAGVKTLVTTHLGPAMDRPGIRERVLADFAALYSGKVVWGEDLMTFDLGPAAA